MKYLLSATAEQVAPIAVHLLHMWLDATDADERLVLGAARRELVAGVRYCTLEWVMTMLEQEASKIDYAGYHDTADKWHRAADMLHAVLHEMACKDD